MYFKDKICPKCGASYDPALKNCPCCNTENDDPNISKSNMTWLPISQQLLAFIIGFAGFHLLTFIFSLIFSNLAQQDQIQGLLYINLSSYLLIFIAFAILGFRYLNQIFYRFNKLRPYVFGLVAGIILIGLSTLISYLIGLAHPGTNENQSIAVNLVKRYPIVSIFLLGIIGPIVEEFTYRIGLFSFLKRVNRPVAYIGTIIVFTLIHINIFNPTDWISELISIPNYVLAAFILSYTYEKEGTVASCIAHILNNLVSVIQILIVSNIG